MNKKIFSFLALILLLGVFLRFYNLGSESFWLDEGTTGLTIKKYDALGILNNVIKKGQILPDYYLGEEYYYDEDLPMYYILLSGWKNIFGMSEFALRSFSALLSSLALIAVFYLAKYLFDEKIALISTFLSSISLTLLWYSQETRQYSYLLFLSILSVIFLLKGIKEDKKKYFAGLLIVNAFIIYSHFPWLLFIAFEGLYSLYMLYQDYTKEHAVRKKIIVAFLIIALLYLPIIGRAIFSETKTTNLYGKPDIGQIAQFGTQLSSWLYPSVEMRQKIYDSTFNFSLNEWALLLSVILTAAIMLGFFLIGIKKSHYKKESTIFLLFMFLTPVILALILSWIHPAITIFQLKQMIYIIPAFIILVSVGVEKTKLTVPFIIVIIALSLLPIGAYYKNVDKQQFREAAAFLPRDEPIFITIDTARVIFQYYYGESENVIGITKENFMSKINDAESFWVMLTFTQYSDPKGSIKEHLDKNYNLVEEKDDLFDIRLLHYKKK